MFLPPLISAREIKEELVFYTHQIGENEKKKHLMIPSPSEKSVNGHMYFGGQDANV